MRDSFWDSVLGWYLPLLDCPPRCVSKARRRFNPMFPSTNESMMPGDLIIAGVWSSPMDLDHVLVLIVLVDLLTGLAGSLLPF